VLGNPQLRDLNFWYRKYSQDNAMENLVLAEGRPERFLGITLPKVIGTVVLPGSSDAGLPELPLTVDEDHTGISKPSSRDAEVYIHVRDFLRRPFGAGAQVTQTMEALEKNTTELQKLTESTQGHGAAIADLKRVILERSATPKVDTTFIDTEIRKRLERLRKCRLFGAFDTTEEARHLAASLRQGDLALGSDATKGVALAWCARFLSMPAPEEAESILNGIAVADAELSGIARGLVTASRGDLASALVDFDSIGSPLARGAAYISVLKAKGENEADLWLAKTKLVVSDLDSDARFFHLKQLLDSGEWDGAFEAAKGLSDVDYDRSPGLIFAAADAFLLQAVPLELRMFLMQYLPFDASSFPLRTEPAALENRRTATKLYERMRSAAVDLGMPGVAGHADEKALWLRLMDPETRSAARKDLDESIKDPATLLRRLGLALQFGINVDLERAEQEVDRQTALSGGKSQDAAAARFALAFTKKDHAAAAAYVNEHREQLVSNLDWKAVYFFEIEMLATSNQVAQAEARLNEAVEKGLSEQEVSRLRRQLSEATGSDPITERLAAYEVSKSITDLRILVSAYEDAENWEKTAEYGKMLLDLTGDIVDARRMAVALYNTERLDEALAVFQAYPVLLTRYDALQLLQAQALFESGNLKDALAALQAVRQTKDSANARQLQINLAVASGNWESLQGFVEAEWAARSDRTPREILRAGQIAQHIGATRGKELVREAARRAQDDPVVLIGCYGAASSSGWEGSLEVHQWMERAAELSGSDGPVQKATIEEIVERAPGWERQQSNTWDLLAKGEVPIFTAGRFLNRSLLGLFLLPSLSNLDEQDVRKRPFVFAFSGARGKYTVAPKIVAIDATALVTAEFLDLLDVFVNTFDSIVIPHSTLGWLLEEKAKVLFHQPSRVATAREFRRMISEGHLQVLDGRVTPPESLVNEIGESLATMIVEAASKEHPDTQQRLVVRGGPVHRVNTLMREEADLTAYEAYLCSSFDVVDKLVEKSVLTTREAEDARAALTVRERPWPSKPQIADGAILYLDDLAVSHLEFLGLLPKLHRGGITAVVSRGEVDEADALIAYDAKGAEVVEVVERLRLRVREELESGKIKLGKSIRVEEEDGPEGMMSHPTGAMLKLIGEADVGIVDDRFVNQHASIASRKTAKPLLTTIDVIDFLAEQGAVSAERRLEARTKLRRANFVFVPVDADELSTLIGNANVADGCLVESAELRAVRENVQRTRMSDILQSPKEFPWLNGLGGACLLTLKNQWKDGMDESAAVAKSDWLLEIADVRGWTHRLNESPQQLTERYRNWVAMLMMLPAIQPEPVKEAYWRWFESRFLQPIQEEDPEGYAFLIGRAKELVAQGVETTGSNMEDADE